MNVPRLFSTNVASTISYIQYARVFLLLATHGACLPVVADDIGGSMQDDVEKWLKELKRGATKFSILAILHDGDMYGYELRHEFETRTKGIMVLTEGNAYPALHSMESDGLVTSYWKDTGQGLPPRKYYHMTEKGEMLLNEMIREWNRYTEAMNNIWRGKRGDQ